MEPSARLPARFESRTLRTLYLCYFALREPLVQTQVLPYLRQLRRGGIEVYLLTFEPGTGGGCTDRGDLEPGIRWFSLPYHKRPTLPATLFDIGMGAWVAARLVRRYGITILHARSHVAAAMGALAKLPSVAALGSGLWALGLGRRLLSSRAVSRLPQSPEPRAQSRKRSEPRLIFDIRGLMAEEYVDAGIWPAGGVLYRLTKRVERKLLAAADGFVVLTERAREMLFPGCAGTDPWGRPIEVVPCCVDADRFRLTEPISRTRARRELGLEGRTVLVYVGALGGWYLTEAMADFMALACRDDPATFLMILTQSPPEWVASLLRERGVEEERCLILSAAPEAIPDYLRAADLALSFIKPCFSKLSSSPTKIAEYLASGLPVVSNRGIGDLDSFIEADRVGVMVPSLDPDGYRRALQDAAMLSRDPGIAARCRTAARARFDLETVGGPRYRRLYERVLGDCHE